MFLALLDLQVLDLPLVMLWDHGFAGDDQLLEMLLD